MSAAVALAGWLAAAGLLIGALGGRRERLARAEALARISHELRGPLTAVGLALSAERRGRQSVGAQAPVPGTLRGVELELGRAAAVLEDLDALAAGRWRYGNAPRHLEPVALDALAAEQLAGWAAVAAARGVQVEAGAVAGGDGATVLGDRARLAQATGNLIANAIEHGGGSVRVRCRCGRDTVRLEVSDDGPGLRTPVEELVCRPRGGRGRRGRGLAIAAEVAAGHGGRLAAAPSRSGARLVLELPRISQ